MARRIYDVLRKDHEAIRDLLLRMENTASTHTRDRTHLFEEFKLQLIPHMRAEEEFFYTLLEERSPDSETMRQSRVEHSRMDSLVNQIQSTSVQSAGWLIFVRQIRQEFERHFREEEETVFERARSILSDEEAQQLARHWEDEKAKYLRSAA
jgi:hemerythrin superfamily protein